MNAVLRTNALLKHATYCAVALALLVLSHCISHASERSAELPSDGSWARYHVIMKFEGDGKEYIGKFTISSVGHQLVDGEQCRWIEFKHSSESLKHPEILKILIPENQLRNSGAPTEHVLKSWYQYNDGNERKIASPGSRMVRHYEIYLLFLPALLKNSKTAKTPIDVEYQKGKLSISNAQSGHHIWSFRRATGSHVFRLDTEYVVWRDPSLPIGFAKAQMKTIRTDRGRHLRSITRQFLLEETGGNAKSGLPNNN